MGQYDWITEPSNSKVLKYLPAVFAITSGISLVSLYLWITIAYALVEARAQVTPVISNNHTHRFEYIQMCFTTLLTVLPTLSWICVHVLLCACLEILTSLQNKTEQAVQWPSANKLAIASIPIYQLSRLRRRVGYSTRPHRLMPFSITFGLQCFNNS